MIYICINQWNYTKTKFYVKRDKIVLEVLFDHRFGVIVARYFAISLNVLKLAVITNRFIHVLLTAQSQVKME